MDDGFLPDPGRAALLAMDCQRGLVSIYTRPEEDFVGRASARPVRGTNGGHAGHSGPGRVPAGIAGSQRPKEFFAAVKSSPQHQELFRGPAGVIHPALGPEPNDIVITKHRVSAFAGTDLQMILRAGEIETIVLFGIATSGVVLSTLLDACDADYRVVVIADCCADRDAELHDTLLKRLFPHRAEVIMSDDFVKGALRVNYGGRQITT